VKRTDFLKLIASRLYPVLRADGFRGSGITLRRIVDPVIHVFNVQGSSTAAGCYINLGAHLSFLPAQGGGSVESSSIKEPACSFRTRVVPPEDKLGGRWPYGSTPSESSAVVDRMIEEWRGQGDAFFARFASYPDSFVRLVQEAVAKAPHPGSSLAYARIAVQVGLGEEGRVIAQRALEAAPPGASSLRASLRRFLEEKL
jgi:hypothetical protein